MDEKVLKLKTPEECEVFAVNVIRLGHPELAVQARERAVQLRAQAYGVSSEIENECLEAIFAYEEALSVKNGKRTRASRTWQMVDRHGIVSAVERAVNRKDDAMGYMMLKDIGLQDYTFEAIVLRHPNIFSADVVNVARLRITER